MMSKIGRRMKSFSQAYLEESRHAGLFDQDFIPNLMQFLGLKDGIKILDVGTGLGYLMTLMDKSVQNCQIHGVDIQRHLLNEVRRSRNGGQNEFFFEAGDGRQLPFKDRTFDIVTCLTVLMHVPHAENVITEMKRVCKVGGCIIAIEGIPRYAPMAHYCVDAPPEVLSTVTDLVKMEIDEFRAEDSDYEIALKLPRHFMDAGLENICAKGFSSVWFDYGRSIEKQRAEAKEILKETIKENVAVSKINHENMPNKESFFHRMQRVENFMTERAEKVLQDPRYAKGVGDIQVKTMFAVKGIRT